MTERFIAACVQTASGPDMAANLEAAADLVRRARDAGADLIALPENVPLMAPRSTEVRARAAPLESHPALLRFRALAEEIGAWLLVGSIAVGAEDGRVANRSVLLDGDGRVVQSYDKIHMFDVDLPSGERYRESETFRAGSAARLAETPWGVLGMTVCYDLRFPQLYRALAQAGAGYLTIPSAFTKVTGEAHWHVLLRARAIENGCFVLAPAQTGNNYGSRYTFGHSLIVDPWGTVLADGGTEVGVVSAEIDPARIDEVRAMIPSLAHDRPFAVPEPRVRAVAGD